ncbi:MAG TPA: hypothetical protein VKY90_01340 [Candidatus Dormibacteraeota bacterium]|nr:hypothetical protein [Candidatus Dormibacteraeota bacterium]
MPLPIVFRSFVAGGTLLVMALPVTALAHEHRTVGPYRFVVGWKVEPAYSDSINAVQLFLTDANGNPVPGACNDLTVRVENGSQESAPLRLSPVFNSPTECDAPVLPTRPGTYTFRFTGSIDGTPIDQSFTSSERTFSNVEDASAIQFPTKDPTRGELAQRQARLALRDQANVERADRLAIAALAVAGAALLILLAMAVRGWWRRPRSRSEVGDAGEVAR